jgi:hypothetical protein
MTMRWQKIYGVFPPAEGGLEKRVVCTFCDKPLIGADVQAFTGAHP